MKLLIKYLKPYSLLLVLCIGLLFGQAVGNLTLPNLMSDIVNVGIQKGGINESTPTVITKEGYELVKMFMTEEGKAKWGEGYTLVKPNDPLAEKYSKDFDVLKENEAYVVSTDNSVLLEELGQHYATSTGALVNFMKALGGDQPQEGELNIEEVDPSTVYQLMPMILATPQAEKDTLITQAKDNMQMSQMVGAKMTALLYKDAGADLGEISRGYIVKSGGYMLFISLLVVCAAVATGMLAARIGAGVARTIRHDVFSKTCGFSSAEFNNFSTASLITRTTNDVQQVQNLVLMGLRLMAFAPVMGIGGTIMALQKSPSLSWIIALAVALVFALIMVAFTIAMPKFKVLQTLVDKLNLVSRENLTGMLVIRAFGNEGYEEERFDSAAKNLRNTERFVQRTMSFMMPGMTVVMNGITLLIVWVGANQIAQSTMQIGDMMAFMQYAMQIIMSFLMIAMMFIMVPRAFVSIGRIKEVLDTENLILDPVSPAKIGKLKGIVEYKDVSFKYNNAENDVVENISFVAKPGETTAFIGSTGSGKSTLVNLLPRFFDVTQGSILIDGVDLRDMSIEQLRDNIGYVPQKGVLFSGDIGSNIRYGKEDADDAQVNVAIDIAQAREFVDATDSGLANPIAQGGGNVSGGQKQRLAIARALVKKPPIYIFDDSFSALDFKTDAALRRALKEHTGSSTVLIVAQRISTIMEAHQIVVLDQGRVVGKGTHRELLQNCLVYKEIAESQLSKEELK